MTFVVDASVTLGWCFRDEQNEYARSVLRRLARDAAIVPALWGIEVANGLLVAERRRRVTRGDLVDITELLAILPITATELAIEDALSVVLDLARDQDLTAYDAVYLDLAMREGLPLATQDEDLVEAANRVGVTLIA